MWGRLVLCVALLLAPSYTEGGTFAHRIILKRGQTAVTMTGRIPTPGDVVLFVFKAQSGQHVSIRLQPNRHLVTQAVLLYPSGKQAGPGTDLNCNVDESGTYRIRVTPREQTAGTFRLYFHLR
jgi:hypothetical protein